LVLVLGACAGCDVRPGAGSDPTPSDIVCGSPETVISLETADGETLEADWWPAASADRGAIVLLHMIPPNNDRSGYPLSVREALHALDVSVLNVDRRGAGGSTGTPAEAYEGAGGRLDVEAAVRFLLAPERNCPVDSARLGLVGASNGTTSVYDYAVARSTGLPRPAAVAFLSPGAYTTNQHEFPTDASNRAVDLSYPFLWLYPTTEPWSEAYVDGAPKSWRFVERGQRHGTQMFDGGALEENTVADLTAWAIQSQGGQ